MPRKGENIYKRKDARWEGRYIRSYDSKNKAKYAYIYGKTYSEVKRKLAEKRSPPSQKANITTRNSLTYDELLDLWLHSSQLNTKESTHAHYSHLISTHIKPQLGKYVLSMISAEIIENFIELQLSEGRLDHTGGLTPKIVTDILTIIKSTIEYAGYKGMPVACNLSKLAIKKNEKEMRVLTQAEQDALASVLIDDMDLYKFGVLLALYTGIRVGELCALQWEDFNLAKKHKDTKNFTTHTGYWKGSFFKNKNSDNRTKKSMFSAKNTTSDICCRCGSKIHC